VEFANLIGMIIYMFQLNTLIIPSIYNLAIFQMNIIPILIQILFICWRIYS